MQELGFAMDLMNFETNEQKQQREWEYWVKQQEYQNGNINSKDYQTRYKAALSSVQNLLSQYEGIPMLRSAEQMAQDILKAIDN
jgi:tRNA U38,U39,U40 pseudouridine synthase TruA